MTEERPPAMEPPEYPKLRPLEPRWVEHDGRQFLYLRDPLALSDHTVLVPMPLVPLLGLMDGTRNARGLQGAAALRMGVALPLEAIEGLVARLDEALLLENGLYRWEAARALREYRQAPHRPPSHAGLVYPENAQELQAMLDGFCSQVAGDGPKRPEGATGELVGMVCPHIDYLRGGSTYARLWLSAQEELDDLELVVILGTDHAGEPGAITLTAQSYATPLGVLPTEGELVAGMARAVGEERAFAQELHHRREHSIEMAAVWLHHFLKGRSVPLLPVLCGSFQHFTEGQGAAPREDPTWEAAAEYLMEVTVDRRTLVVAAGDLAHVGPAFGDPAPLDPVAKADLRARDSRSIEAVTAGDADAFLRISQEERDARRLCGLPCIYLLLRVLEGARGIATGYDQCPADEGGGSVVSIAGALLYK